MSNPTLFWVTPPSKHHQMKSKGNALSLCISPFLSLSYFRPSRLTLPLDRLRQAWMRIISLLGIHWGLWKVKKRLINWLDNFLLFLQNFPYRKNMIYSSWYSESYTNIPLLFHPHEMRCVIKEGSATADLICCAAHVL